jgi:hypothetical protein
MGSGRAGVSTQPRFLRSTGQNRNEAAWARHPKEDQDQYTMSSLARGGLNAFRARYPRKCPRAVWGYRHTVEIPQVGGARTRPNGAGAVSARRLRPVYHFELGLARIECVPGEIFAEVGLGVRVTTRVRFLRSTGPKCNRAAWARCQHEARGPYTTPSLVRRG